MIVLNDIELLNSLRILNLLEGGGFCFSNIFMTKHYLTVVERQSLEKLSVEGKLDLFDTGNDFYAFLAGFNIEESPIGMPGLSSVFYAKENNFALVTKCEITKKIAEKNGVLVYDYDEALRKINTQQAHIDYINKMLNMI